MFEFGHPIEDATCVAVAAASSTNRNVVLLFFVNYVANDPTDAQYLHSEKNAKIPPLIKQVVKSSLRRYEWCGKSSSS